MELWDLYNADREKLGQTMVRGDKQPEGTYRIIVHVCIFNNKGEMLIQQRQPFKKGWSNMWDLSVGGSAVSGDNSRSAAQRELFEELGLEIDFENINSSLTIHFDRGFDDVYLITRDIDISNLALQYEEVQAVKWATADEIKTMIDKEIFIPYHKSLIDLLFFMRNNNGTHTRHDNT